MAVLVLLGSFIGRMTTEMKLRHHYIISQLANRTAKTKQQANTQKQNKSITT